MLADALLAAGHGAHAFEIHSETLAKRRRVLGRTHELTLASPWLKLYRNCKRRISEEETATRRFRIRIGGW